MAAQYIVQLWQHDHDMLRQYWRCGGTRRCRLKMFELGSNLAPDSNMFREARAQPSSVETW
eukprot:2845502-Rhodomonas_salina.3